MKKTSLLLVVLLLISTGCGNIVARKDKSQIVQFENTKIIPDKYDITFYRLLYPNTPNEKDKFYAQLDVLASKILAHKKDINLIIPLELYKDLHNLQLREVRESEKVFYKHSYSLTDMEREFIDSKIKVNTPENSGSVQKYLNKQIAYWYSYLKKSELYNENKNYTELDKDRIVDEVFENRKRFSNTIFALGNNLTIEVTVDTLAEGAESGLPIFLNTDSLPDNLDLLKSKIYVVKGEIEDSVIPNKLLLIANKNVKNIKDFEINTKILDITNPLELIPILDEYQDLKIKDMQNFKIKLVPNSVLEKASLKRETRERQTIDFEKSNVIWGIEK